MKLGVMKETLLICIHHQTYWNSKYISVGLKFGGGRKNYMKGFSKENCTD